MSKKVKKESENGTEAVAEKASDITPKGGKLAFIRSGWFIAGVSVLAFAVMLGVMIGVAVGKRSASRQP